jgi:glucose/arabinose dehydrogenase
MAGITLGATGEAFSGLKIQAIASGLDKPVSVTHAGDHSGRLFITLQEGTVIIFDGTRTLPTPFLDVTSLVSCCGERGLLSVAFHPDYSKNGLFFINYTDKQGDTVISRYKVTADPNVADSKSGAQLLKIDQPYANHNGGQLQFGPDRFLYIGMGDGGSRGDPENRAQDLGDLLGKMLRIDIGADGKPYSIPPSNPFLGNNKARPEIWAYGLRNPWRFSFDRLTHEMLIADVGQDKWEEVHFQRADSRGGENYGWRLMEGNHCYNPSQDCKKGKLELPILEYDHSLGCSITGGYVYRGSLISGLVGTYLYADYCTGRIWGAKRTEGNRWVPAELLKTEFQISTFGEDEEGELYFADHTSGTIYRISDLEP